MEKNILEIRPIKELQKSTHSLLHAYITVFGTLAFIAIVNYLIISEMIRFQSRSLELTKAVVDQRETINRVAKIVDLILRTLEKNTENTRVYKLAQKDLNKLVKKIEDNQLLINTKLNKDYSPLSAVIKLSTPIFVNKDSLAGHINQLILKLKHLTEQDSIRISWKFSIWAPIQLELSSHNSIANELDDLTKALYQNSFDISKQFSQIHNQLIIATIISLLLEAVFIFYPLINRLKESIEKLYKANGELDYLAKHDSLTTAGNWLYFKYLLKQFVEDKRQNELYLILLDLDNFKNINDIHGHHAGDYVLSNIADRMKKLIKENMNLFRIGGDEFAIVARNADETVIKNTIREIISVTNKPILYKNRSISVNLSMGITTEKCSQMQNADTLYKNADFALRSAKNKGGGVCVSFDETSQAILAEKEQLLSNFISGMKTGEVVPYYQPILDMKTMQVVGAEALVRWNCLGYGLVSVAEYLPVLDEFEMLGELLDHILICLAKDRQKMLEEGANLNFIGINFPDCALNNPGIVEHITNLLKTTDLSWLHIEILETVLLNRSQSIIEDNLKNLRRLGAHISLDDFGTGYASLTHLRNFPCDSLKIDRSFVLDLFDETGSELIIKSIIDMAHGLRLKVTIEGIENERQFEFFGDWAGLEGQGFYFYKPMPLSDLTNIILSNN